MHNRIKAAATVILLTAGLAACSTGGSEGESSEGAAASFPFQLNWTAGGANAGFAVAAAEGLYKDAGLDVELIEGTGSSVAVQLVASNQVGIGFADATAVSQLVAQGAPLKVVATIYQATPNTVEALSSSGIDSVADLKGRRVGMPQGASQASMLPLLLEANGLTEGDIEIVNTPNDARVATLLQGDVDAIMGGADSSSVQLEQQGADFNAMLWADFGVSTVAQSIFANQSFLNEHPDQVKAFVAASVAGWAAAGKNPEGAATDLKQVFPDIVETTALAELKGVIPLLCAGGAEVMGRAEPAQWERTGELLIKAGLLPAGTLVADYYTYDYLPSEAELPVCG